MIIEFTYSSGTKETVEPFDIKITKEGISLKKDNQTGTPYVMKRYTELKNVNISIDVTEKMKKESERHTKSLNENKRGSILNGISSVITGKN